MNLLLKFIFFLVVICLGYQTSYGQRRTVNHLPKYDKAPYHFGFILALNQMNLTYKPVESYQDIAFTSENTEFLIPDDFSFFLNEITSESTAGFGVGIVGNLRLLEHLDLRFVPTLSFGDRIVIYYPNAMIANNNKPVSIIKKYLPSTSVDFPIHLKYRSKRLNNFAAYLVGGVKYSIEMASNRKIDQENDGAPIKIDRNDFAIDAGVGFDFYTPYFKFGTELKMSYGLKNILVNDNYLYSLSLERLNNKIFQLAFTFE